MGVATPVVTPAGRRGPVAALLVSALLVGALAWALAWALAGQRAAPADAAVRAVADVAGVAALGLAVLPVLDEPRHRPELRRAAERPLAVAAVVWLIAEATRLTLAAAAAADVAATKLSLHTALDFAGTAGGRAILVTLTAAGAVCVMAVLRPAAPAARVTLAGTAAVGVAARAVSGHLADRPLAAVAVTLHILAAALWCGALAAAALSVRHRGQWARLLPGLSRLALTCVSVLLVGGLVGASATVPAWEDLLTSGYGRVLLAKAAATGALLALGWHNRSRWVPAARAHRVDAERSRRRALREVLVMLAALTLAAALAVTG